MIEGSSIGFTHHFGRFFTGQGHRHLISHLFDLVNISGVFGRQFLLRQAGRIASQGDDAIFNVNLGLYPVDAPMKDRRTNLTFSLIQASEFAVGGAPLISSLLSTLLTPDKLAMVSSAKDLWDSSETSPVKMTTPPFGLDLDIIVFEKCFKDIGLLG